MDALHETVHMVCGESAASSLKVGSIKNGEMRIAVLEEEEPNVKEKLIYLWGQNRLKRNS